MALVERSYQLLTIQMRDRDLNKSSVEMRFSALLDLTDFLAAIPTVVVAALAGISDAVVVGWTLTRQAVDSAPALPGEASDVERKGVFSALTDNGHTVTVSVPSILNTKVIDRTNQINLADAAVITFTNILDGTTLLDTAFMVSNRDEPVIEVIKGEKHHRASSKG